MISGIIKAALSILDSLLGLRLLREQRKVDPVQQGRVEEQQQVAREDETELNIAKAAQGDQAALDALRRAAAE